MQKWRKENPEKVKAILKRFKEKHPEYQKYFKEKQLEYQKTHRKQLKDKYGLGAGTVSRYGFSLALQVYEKFNRKCSICGDVNDLTIHHLDGNGRNHEEKGLFVNNKLNNLVLICRRCHGSIHGKEGKGIKKSKRKGSDLSE